MKTTKTLRRPRSHRHIPKAHAALALILIGLSPALAHGQEKPANPDINAQSRATYAEKEAHAHKAALDALDHQIDAIETHLDLLPEGVERDQARQRLDHLKDRRTELRKAYLASKYEQLKADVQTEYEKVAAWTREKYENVKASMSDSDADTSVGATVHQTSPSPENEVEIKAALRSLEIEIERLKAHAESMPEGEKRTIFERRVEAIEDRKDELENNFTKARWDALVADLKREWNELSR